jgi:hypothetical protein
MSNIKGVTMGLPEVDKINTYQILVKEIQGYHTTKWCGSLFFIPQENGETYLELSFIDQGICSESHDQLWDPNNTELSVECVNKKTENSP